ncbi:SdpI family protein [Candidatus Woesearchaeota archaeon]|nr:SdpI family protein [Candidatus Woesearchaeota archaeon]
MKRTILAAVILIIAAFAISAYYYPQFPEQIASHWNSAGEVDGYMGKFWGLFLMPIITAALLLLFLIIPKIDPLRKNVEKFRAYFDNFILIIIGFMFYIHLLTIVWNSGTTFSMGKAMAPAMAVIFYYAGVLMGKAKRNWFIGIRTPWTLSSDEVWDKTHKLGAKLFKIAAAVVLFGMLFAENMLVVLVPVLLAAFIPIIYSYFEYKKAKKST